MIDESHARTLCLWSLNYLLLSTLFVSVVWCLCKSRRLTSDSLRDQLWKLALIAPIVFTFVHAVWQPSSLNWNLAGHLVRENSGSVPSVNASSAPLLKSESISAISEKNDDGEFTQEEDIQNGLQSFPEFSPVIADPFLQAEFAPFVAHSVEHEIEPPDSPELTFPVAVTLPSKAEMKPGQFVQAAVNPVPLPASQTSIESNLPTPQITVVPAQLLSYWSIVASLLGVVICFGVLRVMLQSFLVSRKISRFKTVEAGLAKETLSNLQLRLECPFQIELLESSTKIEPAACGIWRRKILVPANLTEHLSADEIEALLAHEVAHLLRRDPVWAWSLHLIRSCLCWQPLNFLAVKKWRMAAELCCDANAVAAGVDRLKLARCLTRVATWKLAASTTLGVGASTSTLGIRVERLVAAPLLLDPWSPGCRRSLRWVLLLVLLPLMLRFAPSMSWDVQAAAVNAPVEQFDATLANDSNQVIKVAQPLPMKEELPFAEPLSIPPQTAEPFERSVAAEIQGLTTELNYALELLSDQEDDPEIFAGIAAIQAKLEKLNARASEIDTSSTSRNSASVQE